MGTQVNKKKGSQPDLGYSAGEVPLLASIGVTVNGNNTPSNQTELQESVAVTINGNNISSNQTNMLESVAVTINGNNTPSNQTDLQAKYEDLFMRCNDSFLYTYRNTLHYVWASIDCFYANFGKVPRPGELVYKLWQIVTMVRIVITASNDILKQFNAGSFGIDSAPYLLSEMKFFAKSAGHIGKAINILTIFLESSEIWREKHGSELDLGAHMLENEVNETILSWEIRTTNLFTLSPLYVNKLKGRISTEALCLKEALFLEHVELKEQECLIFLTQRRLPVGLEKDWDMQDFSGFLFAAHNLAKSFMSRSITNKKAERFIHFMQLLGSPNLLTRKSKLPDINSISFSAIINNAAPFRIIYFENQTDFLTIKTFGLEFKEGLLINSLPKRMYFNGQSDHPDEMLTYLLRVSKRFTSSALISAQQVHPDHLNEVRFYAQMKSPIHLLLLYGGIVLFNGEEGNCETLFVFDKGCDILLSHPLRTSSTFAKVHPILFTEDFYFTQDFKHEVGCIIESPSFDPVEQMLYFGRKRHLAKKLFGLVTSSDNDRANSQGNILWQFIVLEENVYNVTRTWKQNSFISRLMIDIQTSQNDWVFNGRVRTPMLLKDLALGFSFLNL